MAAAADGIGRLSLRRLYRHAGRCSTCCSSRRTFFSSAIYTVVGPYMSEIWPARLRSSGMGMSYGIGNLGGKVLGPAGLAVIMGAGDIIKPAAPNLVDARPGLRLFRLAGTSSASSASGCSAPKPRAAPSRRWTARSAGRPPREAGGANRRQLNAEAASAVLRPVVAPQEIGPELVEARAADLAHDEVDLAAEDVDRLLDPGKPAGDRAVKRRAAEEDELRRRDTSAIRMSAPRRTPLSSITVTLSPTAALIAGNASSEAGAWSSWRPPWFDTMMPSTPISAARTASRRVQDALDDQRARERGGGSVRDRARSVRRPGSDPGQRL